ncbi:hypothetical protein [Microbacterium alcoholitolerans]|uniref:hypothetical protein n=1 Tax=unclassified Microbacterium TaxID=2609290 RepID=UPI003D18196C
MRGIWSRLLRGRDRGMVEVGVAFGGALLVVGAIAGNGVAALAVDMSDGQAWLPGQDGSVVQVNPSTGVAERRLVVGDGDTSLSIAQRDGALIVTDERSGLVTAVDLAALIASGSRATSGDERVLVGGGRVVVVDDDPGTVRAVDPLTLADIGKPFRTAHPITDAVVDGDGDVWVLTDDGELTQLEYSDGSGRFRTEERRPVAGAGPETRLVPHERGVTVFAADGGAVVQVGSGSDLAVTVPALSGSIAAAPHSPATLVPASVTDTGQVFLLSSGSLLQVDVGERGCTRPGSPQVFSERVYVPCLGTGTVMVLDARGKRAGADIIIPGGGDPVFTADEGRLFVTTDRDGRAVVVQPDGSTGMVDLGAPDVPEVRVDREPPVTIPAPDRGKKNEDRDRSGDQGRPSPRPSQDPVAGSDPLPDPLPGADPTPGTNPQPTPGADPTPGTDPTPGADPTPGSDPTPDPDPTPGTTPTPDPDPTPTSDPDPDPTPSSDPDPDPEPEAAAATNISAVASGRSVTVTWNAAPGGADEYLVRPAGGSWTSAGTSRSLTFSNVGFGTHTYTVRTVLGGTTAESAASNAVTVVGSPGAAGTPSVTGLTGDGSAVDFSVSWAASASNGAPVTYSVELSGAGRTETVTTTATSLSRTLVCGAGNEHLCGRGAPGETRTITVSATVTPSNSVGAGASTTGSANAQVVNAPLPPTPENGADVISGIQFNAPGLYDDDIPFTVYVSLPEGWSATSATCTVHLQSSTGAQTRNFDCTSGGGSFNGMTRGMSTVSAYVTRESFTSATGSDTAPPRNTWAHCSMATGICTDPVGFDPTDPDVSIVPVPWSPTDGTDEPILAAGIGLLGVAWLLRGIRRRAETTDGLTASDPTPTTTGGSA